MAGVLASVAAYEVEVRGERVRAGQQVARAAGKTWGGRKVGQRIKLTEEREAAIKRLRADGASIAAIARTTGVSRPSVYTALSR
jgi:DNA invertase Pin-like site-specific DNA recombinase